MLRAALVSYDRGDFRPVERHRVSRARETRSHLGPRAGH